MAPEMVLKQEYSGPAIDIWAAGVVFYTILFGT
jgi:serine/threonine protein kinase